MADDAAAGTSIGISNIKDRRLQQSRLRSHPDLFVGDCVPFYFCPRSVMLYLLHRANHPNLGYRGGQEPIVHLEADLHRVMAWAEAKQQRWAITFSCAGSAYFEDSNIKEAIGKLDWDAIAARQWTNCKEGKQAEFLLEERFPFHLIERIGVFGSPTYRLAVNSLQGVSDKPLVEVRPEWYY